MKKNIIKTMPVIFCILIPCLLFFMVSCHTKHISTTSDGKSYSEEGAVPDQLVIWRKPGKTKEEYEKWLKDFQKKNGEVNEQNTCGSCDNSLILLAGPGVQTFIQTSGITGKVSTGTSTPTTGDEGPIYVSQNYRVRHRKPAIQNVSAIEKPVPGSNAGKPVKVAIFDTGTDPSDLSNYTYNFSGECCIKGAERGWNFINNSADYRDDDLIKHGTIITRFIIDQVNKQGKEGVEILPVKTHDANGGSSLFNILCALAYAQKSGAKIINASFGFYAPRRKLSPEDDAADPNVLLLRKYIEHYLTQNKILLVAAAGNLDKEYLKKTFEDHGSPYRPDNPRDLDEFGFYPASLSRSPDFNNVIAVTTISTKNRKGTVSPDQNFSKNVLDIGVEADAELMGQFVFKNPILNHGETVGGSSFATAIVTGVLCANYSRIQQIVNRKDFKKNDIWRALGPGLVKSNQALKDEIKNGLIMTK